MKRVLWIVALLALVLAGVRRRRRRGRLRRVGGRLARERPRLRRQDDQARGADAADRPGGGDRPAADGRQRGLLRLRQLEGGIAGKYKVELVQEDTQYSPPTTVQQYNKIKNNVVAFTQVLGTAPTLAALPQLVQDKIIAAPASLDAFWVREPNLLPVGGPYQVQAINALDYYINQADGKGKNICSFIQDDAYGEAGQSGVDFAAEKLGFKVVDTQKFKVGDKDVTGQVQRLQGSKCDAVFLVATPTDAGTIWGTAAKLGYAPRWIGQSPTWIDELGASPLAEYLQQTTWIVAEGTEWGDDDRCPA